MVKLNKLLFNREGFTLIELMIVIVVLGILAAIAVPKISNISDKAKIASVKSDLHNIQTALELHYADKGFYPTALSELNVSTTEGYTFVYSKDYSVDDTTYDYIVYVDISGDASNYLYVLSGETITEGELPGT